MQARTDPWFARTEADNPTGIPMTRNSYAFAFAHRQVDPDIRCFATATFDGPRYRAPPRFWDSSPVRRDRTERRACADRPFVADISECRRVDAALVPSAVEAPLVSP